MDRQQFNEGHGWLLEGIVPVYSRESVFGFEDRMNEIEKFISERPQVVAALLREHLESANLSVDDESR